MAARNTEIAILERLIAPDQEDLSPEAARYLIAIDFTVADRERMNLLAAKARAGELTDEEAVEVQNYRQVSHVLALLHSKARRSLNRAGSGPTLA